MELWDVYDQCMVKQDRTHVRGVPLEEGDYHLIVHVYPVNSKGEILIQKRAANVRTKPNMWAITGGSVLAGEEFLQGAMRELKEEMGIAVDESDIRLLSIMERPNRFRGVWLVRSNVELADLKLQKEEVADAKWATPEEIMKMVEDGEFWHYDYLDWIFNKIQENRKEGWLKA